MELTGYDKKDKVTSKINYEILEASANHAEVKGEMYDDKGKLFNTVEFGLKCEEGVFKVDMSSVLPSEQLAAFESMDVDIETAYISYPSSLSVGQKLPDGEVTITIKNSGVTIMNMTTSVVNRTVEAKENVTTPAGTFTCYKISEETIVDMKMAKTTSKAISWISENVGMVKTESYDKKGKLVGKTLLTAISGL